MEGLEGMAEGLHKAKGGLIRAFVRVEDEKIADILLSGDFIMTPEDCLDGLMDALIGVEADKEHVLSVVEEFYSQNEFQSPGTTAEDFAEALNKAFEKWKN